MPAARSDSERLELWREVRDKLEDAILQTGGKHVVEFTIRQRTMRYADPLAAMEMVEQKIAELEQKTSTNKTARNKIRLRRGV